MDLLSFLKRFPPWISCPSSQWDCVPIETGRRCRFHPVSYHHPIIIPHNFAPRYSTELPSEYPPRFDAHPPTGSPNKPQGFHSTALFQDPHEHPGSSQKNTGFPAEHGFLAPPGENHRCDIPYSHQLQNRISYPSNPTGSYVIRNFPIKQHGYLVHRLRTTTILPDSLHLMNINNNSQ